jgi:DNA-binding Lrp family transcriptional regulator
MWRFLESEMLVILGLAEDATRTDAQIADIYGLKKGTVASVRRRLLDAGAITFANVPAFNKLGCEMIGFHLGTAEPTERVDARADNYIEFTNMTPQLFHGLTGGNSVVFYTALKNATEYDKIVQSHNKFFSGARRGSKARMVSSVFPFALTKVNLVPNFAPIVHRFFDLDVPPPKSSPPVSAEVESPDLGRTERTTLVALVENPRASDREIAAIVGLSRQAITRIRNKLYEEGICNPVCLPRLYKWGFEICAVALVKFNMEVSWEKRLKSQPRECVDLSFYTLSKADEAAANYIVAKYSEYADQLQNILAWYHKARALDESPDITLFSLERSTELRTFEFGPAVRHLMLS